MYNSKTGMKLSDFDYRLPRYMIAQTPAEPRDSSRFMVLDHHGITHWRFYDLPQFLQPGDLLILNNSRVIPARLSGTKETGGRVEVLLVKPLDDNYYECLVKGKINTGGCIRFNEDISGTVMEKVESHTGYRFNIRFQCRGKLETHLQDVGVMPLPPYINAHLQDGERYQTVYSGPQGSIAAPTAGLHFTQPLLNTLKDGEIRTTFITLHVGAGTFMPVRTEDVKSHYMESEYFVIDREAAEDINNTIAENGRIIVVGTTAVRALESACWEEGRIKPSEGFSGIFIYPPYSFKTPISGLITNFHLPRSTLLMLVSAFAGRDAIIDAYRLAIDNGYRFYSFGDAMLIWNNNVIGHV